ncbi:hypothetical protein L1987_85883 [Smallanthus sonchifolius]|uniref:Uncharacterized protein n=1 Tax=Smallanthus sonchifolius TaxID=185202 RepID=A0ACB8XYH7_9ASTR|nr:hypothetical protein L1987_85883 [Smallanthus sonchifolius]
MYFTRNIQLFLFLFVLAITQSSSSQSTTSGDVITITKAANVAKPGCQTQCGNVTIPYPFGIGPDCFLSKWFETTCNTSISPPRPQIAGLQILEFTDYTFRVANKVGTRCYDPFGNVTEDNSAITDLGCASPFSFSQKNELTLIGCDDIAIFVGPPQVNSGCRVSCSEPEEVVNNVFDIKGK